MKKLILLSALLLLTSCSATSPSKIIQKQNQIDNSYTISVTENEYGVVYTDKTSAIEGDIVNLSYIATSHYVLSHYLINGENYGVVSSFAMPSNDVMIEGIFTPVFDNFDLTLTSDFTANPSTSYWTFDYTNSGISINVKVDDRSTVISGDYSKQDYVEILFNKTSATSWVKNETFSLTVTRSGEAFVRKAVTDKYLGKKIFDAAELGNYVLDYNVTEKYETKNEGYRGYEVNILVPYQSLGFTVSNGLNQFKVCPSYSNAISLAQYNWVYYGTWLKPSTHYTFD